MKKVKQSVTKKTKNKYNIPKYKPEVNGNLTHLVFQLKSLIFRVFSNGFLWIITQDLIFIIIFIPNLSEKINIPAPERVFIHANSFHSQKWMRSVYLNRLIAKLLTDLFIEV